MELIPHIDLFDDLSQLFIHDAIEVAEGKGMHSLRRGRSKVQLALRCPRLVDLRLPPLLGLIYGPISLAATIASRVAPFKLLAVVVRTIVVETMPCSHMVVNIQIRIIY